MKVESAENWSPWMSRLVIWCAFVILCLATIVQYATDSTLAALSVMVTDGGVALLWILAAAGVGAGLLRPWLRGKHWALRLSTAIGSGMGLFALALLGLGLAGWLNRPTVWAMFFGGLALGALPDLPRLLKHGLPLTPNPQQHPDTAAEWAWLPLAVNLGMLLVAAAIVPGLLWKPEDPHPYDVLSYHLQVPREWYEMGRIAPLRHNVFSFFPMGMEVHYLAGMHLMGGPWRGMYVAQFINVWLAVTLVMGLYGACRTLRPDAPRLLAIAAAMLAGGTPWTLMLSSVAYAETGLMLFAGLSVTWLLIFLETGRIAPACIAGLLGGFACGVKYPAVPMLVIAATLACLLASLMGHMRRSDNPTGERDDGKQKPSAQKHAQPNTIAVSNNPHPATQEGSHAWRRLLFGCVLYSAVALAAFSPWLVRNLVWAGNPVFPLAMGTFGQGHFSDEQVERFERAHGIPEAQRPIPARLARLGQVWLWDWQFGYLLVPLAAIALLSVIGRPWAMMLLVLGGVALLIWFFFTHLLGRFLTFTIPLSALAIGLHPRRWIAAITATAVAVIVVVTTWINLHGAMIAFGDYGRAGLFAAEDLSFMIPEELDAMRTTDQRIALVGDAGAFFYQIPMERLLYRTVFDVDGQADTVWTAWRADEADVLVIHPAELRRLHQYYAHIPPAPPELAGRTLPLVLPRQALPSADTGNAR